MAQTTQESRISASANGEAEKPAVAKRETLKERHIRLGKASGSYSVKVFTRDFGELKGKMKGRLNGNNLAAYVALAGEQVKPVQLKEDDTGAIDAPISGSQSTPYSKTDLALLFQDAKQEYQEALAARKLIG